MNIQRIANASTALFRGRDRGEVLIGNVSCMEPIYATIGFLKIVQRVNLQI